MDRARIYISQDGQKHSWDLEKEEILDITGSQFGVTSKRGEMSGGERAHTYKLNLKTWKSTISFHTLVHSSLITALFWSVYPRRHWV